MHAASREIIRKKNLLQIKRHDLWRRFFVTVTTILLLGLWTMFALLQYGAIQEEYKIKSLILIGEILGLCIGATFVLCGLCMLYIEKKIEEYSQQPSEQNIENENSKFAKLFNRSGGTAFDLSGSAMILLMQIIVVLDITNIIQVRVSELFTNLPINLQGIVDIIGNLLFFTSTIIFLTQYLSSKNRNLQNKREEYKPLLSDSRQSQSDLSQPQSSKGMTGILSTMVLGAAFVLIGKVFLALEGRNSISYTGEKGPLGIEKLPLAIIIRSIGMLMFLGAYVCLYMVKYQEYKEQEQDYNTLLDKVNINASGGIQRD